MPTLAAVFKMHRVPGFVAGLAYLELIEREAKRWLL